MVTVADLWLPILLSTLLVFVASLLIWAVLRIHRKDFRGLPDETATAEALRRQGTGPGEYVLPYAADPAAMKDPEHVRRWEEGPVALLRLARAGRPRMARKLTQWFVYLLVISLFVAYLASRTLAPGTPYLEVFRVAGTAAVLAYAGAVAQEAIWFWRPWGNVWRAVLDGVIYGLLTAGAFAWLWPR